MNDVAMSELVRERINCPRIWKPPRKISLPVRQLYLADLTHAHTHAQAHFNTIQC